MFTATEGIYGSDSNGNSRRYALAEAGADRHRFQVEHIDPNKGSAVVYIAKYIAKKIGGECISADFYGGDAIAGQCASARFNSLAALALPFGERLAALHHPMPLRKL